MAASKVEWKVDRRAHLMVASKAARMDDDLVDSKVFSMVWKMVAEKEMIQVDR